MFCHLLSNLRRVWRPPLSARPRSGCDVAAPCGRSGEFDKGRRPVPLPADRAGLWPVRMSPMGAAARVWAVRPVALVCSNTAARAVQRRRTFHLALYHGWTVLRLARWIQRSADCSAFQQKFLSGAMLSAAAPGYLSSRFTILSHSVPDEWAGNQVVFPGSGGRNWVRTSDPSLVSVVLLAQGQGVFQNRPAETSTSGYVEVR